MTPPSRPGPYRVRSVVRHERSVPDEASGPRFTNRDEAVHYAAGVVRDENRPVIVEKLAPGGCWLQLTSLG